MPYTKRKREYMNEYLKGLKEVRFRIRPEGFEAWQEKAVTLGFAKEDGTANMRQFILAAVEAYKGGEQ